MKKLEHYNREELCDMLNSSKSFKNFLEMINHSTNGSSAYNSIKKQLLQLNITIPEYSYGHLKGISAADSDCIFVENSTYSRSSLKRKIIKEKLIEYKCDKCSNTGEWMETKLTLQLEHKNGVNNDNRINNLCFLCPNCHSQTESYSGKRLKKKYTCNCGSSISRGSERCRKCLGEGKRKVIRPDIELLKIEVNEIGYKATGRKYGVSDNCIRKWIKTSVV